MTWSWLTVQKFFTLGPRMSGPTMFTKAPAAETYHRPRDVGIGEAASERNRMGNRSGKITSPPGKNCVMTCHTRTESIPTPVTCLPILLCCKILSHGRARVKFRLFTLRTYSMLPKLYWCIAEVMTSIRVWLWW